MFSNEQRSVKTLHVKSAQNDSLYKVCVRWQLVLCLSICLKHFLPFVYVDEHLREHFNPIRDEIYC